MKDINADKLVIQCFTANFPNLDVNIPDSYDQAEAVFIYRFVISKIKSQHPQEYDASCKLALAIVKEAFSAIANFEQGNEVDYEKVKRLIEVVPETIKPQLQHILNCQ